MWIARIFKEQVSSTRGPTGHKWAFGNQILSITHRCLCLLTSILVVKQELKWTISKTMVTSNINMRQNINNYGTGRHITTLEQATTTRRSNYLPKQQVIGGVQGNIGLQGISRVRKLEHRNTDSNRSTGGNKYYKSKIGRKGEMLAWKTLPKVQPKIGRSSHQLNDLIREEAKH